MNLEINNEIILKAGRCADTVSAKAFIVGPSACAIASGQNVDQLDISVISSNAAEFVESLARQLGENVEVHGGTERITLSTPDCRISIINGESFAEINETSQAPFQHCTSFTIDNVAISINSDSLGKIYDEFNGVDDWQRHLIKASSDAEHLFSIHPLEIFRAIELATQLSFRIDNTTFEAICSQAMEVTKLSKHDIAEALQTIISVPSPSRGFKTLEMAGILDLILPELTALKGVQTIDGHGHKDNFAHTLQVLDNIARITEFLPLRWVALAHDIGKPRAKRYEAGIGWTFKNHDYIGEKMARNMFRRLKIFNPETIDYISRLIGLHMRPQQIGDEGITDSAVRRMMTDAGDADDLQDLMMLAEADLTSKNPVKVRRVLDTFTKVRQRLEQIRQFDLKRATPDIINGHEIMSTFGIGPTPELGKIKADVCSYAAENELTHAEAYQYMLDVAPEYGLQPKESLEQLRTTFEEQYQQRQAERHQKQVVAEARKQQRDAALGRVNYLKA